MKNKQNYYIRILLILIIVLSMWWYLSTKKKYREMNTVPHIKMEMKEFLKKRYNEDFDVITVPYIYDDYCEAVITPKRYKGTAKEYDLFYKTEAYMKLKKIPIIDEYEHVIIASNYDSILLKENLEKDLKPKLEKWFGKNVLVALQLEGACYYDDYKKEIQHRREENEDETLSGGIYVFGRVENEKDREKYRKGIYEFIQYLKQEGMFEYTRIDIQVLDERMLSKAFNENAEATESLRELGSKIAATKRNKILKPYDEDLKKTSQEYKDKWIENIRKSNVSEDTYNSILLYTVVRSPKYVKSKGLDTDKRINETLRNYDKIDDVIFRIEGYKID